MTNTDEALAILTGWEVDAILQMCDEVLPRTRHWLPYSEHDRLQALRDKMAVLHWRPRVSKHGDN